MGNPEITSRSPHHPGILGNPKPGKDCTVAATDCGVVSGNHSPECRRVRISSSAVGIHFSVNSWPVHPFGVLRTRPTNPIPLPDVVLILIFSPDSSSFFTVS